MRSTMAEEEALLLDLSLVPAWRSRAPQCLRNWHSRIARARLTLHKLTHDYTDVVTLEFWFRIHPDLHKAFFNPQQAQSLHKPSGTQWELSKFPGLSTQWVLLNASLQLCVQMCMPWHLHSQTHLQHWAGAPKIYQASYPAPWRKLCSTARIVSSDSRSQHSQSHHFIKFWEQMWITGSTSSFVALWVYHQAEHESKQWHWKCRQYCDRTLACSTLLQHASTRISTYLSCAGGTVRSSGPMRFGRGHAVQRACRLVPYTKSFSWPFRKLDGKMSFASLAWNKSACQNHQPQSLQAWNTKRDLGKRQLVKRRTSQKPNQSRGMPGKQRENKSDICREWEKPNVLAVHIL